MVVLPCSGININYSARDGCVGTFCLGSTVSEGVKLLQVIHLHKKIKKKQCSFLIYNFNIIVYGVFSKEVQMVPVNLQPLQLFCIKMALEKCSAFRKIAVLKPTLKTYNPLEDGGKICFFFLQIFTKTVTNTNERNFAGK